MTTFNKGDRVRLSSQADPSRKREVGATEGTVRRYANGRPVVDWDGGKLGYWNNPPEHEIELVTPTRADDLRDKRTALRDQAAQTIQEITTLKAKIDVLQTTRTRIEAKVDTLTDAIKILEDSK